MPVQFPVIPNMHFHVGPNGSFVSLIFVGLGTADCTVDKPGISSGIHGVPEGKRNQRSEPNEGDGLSGCAESTGNFWRGAFPLFQ